MPKNAGYDSLLRAIFCLPEIDKLKSKIKRPDKGFQPLPIDKIELIRVWQKKRGKSLNSFDDKSVVECDLQISKLRKEIAVEIMAQETPIEEKSNYPDSITIPLEILKERLANFYVKAYLQGQEDFQSSLK